MSRDAGHVLTLNGGSSSIKFALFVAEDKPALVLRGKIERIGLADSLFIASNADGTRPENRPIDAADHSRAVVQLIDWLEKRVGLGSVAAVGHRIVHGGPRYRDPQRVTPELLAALHRLSPLDPAHLPGEIAFIEAFTRCAPNLTQVACFDTAFHGAMPRVARLLPLPRRYDEEGVQRYGFHGISYSFLLEELARVAGAPAAEGHVVLAHLGAGASLAALHHGQSIDTTMGFTPTGGVVMGTRSGDLDPGVLLFLMRTHGLTVDEVDGMVNSRSGLLGVSETSSDMRDLLRREREDPRAAEAVALFCYQVKKALGSFAAALGGLDTLVFSGGIGENSPDVRSRICVGLAFLGITLDDAHNAVNAPIISAPGTATAVRVIRTDEEIMIATMVRRVLGTGQ